MPKRVTLLVLLSILTVSYSLDAYSTLYTDKEVESDANIYLVAVKYYDPHVGRFITRDPTGQGVNWNLYTDNNPLTRIDRDGQLWETIFNIGGALYSGWNQAMRWH